MEDMAIRLLSLTENCMQSEGELRFCISLYQIFVNSDFKQFYMEIFVTQSKNTVHKRINGAKSESEYKIKLGYNNLRCHIEILFNKMLNNNLISIPIIQTTPEDIQK